MLLIGTGGYQDSAIALGDDISVEAVEDSDTILRQIDQAVGDIVGEDLAADEDIAVVILGDGSIERLPCLDIAPAESGLEHIYLGSLLHDSHIDRDRFAMGIDIGENLLRGRQREREESIGHLGEILPEILHQHRETPDEDARIPIELAGIDELHSHIDRRFLGESLDLVEERGEGERGAVVELDIAIFDIRVGRLDADSDDPIVVSHDIDSGSHIMQEMVEAEDSMVGRRDDDDGLGVHGIDDGGGIGDARCGIAAKRFAEDLIVGEAGDLPAYHVDAALCGDDDDIRTWAYLLEAAESRLQHRFAGTQDINKLFGVIEMAQRPEAAAGAAGHNYAKDIVIHDKKSIRRSQHL